MYRKRDNMNQAGLVQVKVSKAKVKVPKVQVKVPKVKV